MFKRAYFQNLHCADLFARACPKNVRVATGPYRGGWLVTWFDESMWKAK